MNTIYISGSAGPLVAAVIRQDLAAQMPSPPDVVLLDTRVGIELDATLAANAIAAVASTASLLYAIARDVWQAKRSDPWTPDRLRSVLGREMLTRGVTDHEIADINGFENLLHRKNMPCKVWIKAKGHEPKLIVYVFADGDAVTVNVREAAPADDSPSP